MSGVAVRDRHDAPTVALLTPEDWPRSRDRGRVHRAREGNRHWLLFWLVAGRALAMLGENDGPSMVSYTATGAAYGGGFFLPFIVVTFVMAVVCQEMCMRVGDWLLVALSFSSGVFEAICFLSFRVFTSFQTGNLVFVGLTAGGTRPPQGPDPAIAPVSLATFALGAAEAMPILHSFDGDVELDDSHVRHVWPRQTTMALGLSLAPQVAFLAVWMTYSPPSRATLTLMGLIAFAMGVQMNAVRFLHVPGISTTAATATFIDLVSGIATRSLKASARRLSGVLVGIVLGALLGDLMLRYVGSEAPVVPVVINAMVLGSAAVALKQS